MFPYFYYTTEIRICQERMFVKKTAQNGAFRESFRQSPENFGKLPGFNSESLFELPENLRRPLAARPRIWYNKGEGETL